MKIKLFLLIGFLFLLSCEDDDTNENSDDVVKAATINGGPYNFCVNDGMPDLAKGLSFGGASGKNSTWVITDSENKILELPTTLEETERKDFDQSGIGNCKLWLIHFNTEIISLQKDNNLINDLTEQEKIGLSNTIIVNRTEQCLK